MATEANNPEQAPTSAEILEEATSKSQIEADEGQAEVEAGDESNSTPPKDAPQEELIAGKFKSQDELTTAYQNLEKKLGEQGSELSTLRKTLSATEDYELEEGQPPIYDPVTTETDPDALSTLNNMIESRAKQIVAQELRPLKVEQEINQAKEVNVDFYDLLPQVKQIYDEAPQLRQPGNLNLVIEMARGRQAMQLSKQFKEEGKKEALESVDKKQRAVTEGGKAKSNDAELTSEKARSMSSEELAQLLP